ncbi:MAG: hypothetical protein KDE58_39105, partial [Caldilineaceae bacterium]|nr:hypothetical protein [Caldilineaceae bacterium]
MEITSSNPASRIINDAGSSAKRAGGVYNYGGTAEEGDHNRLINLVIHDLSGVGYGWHRGSGGEIYGTLIYNNGWVAPDRAHGHGIYTQNQDGGVFQKRIVDNIVFNAFKESVQLWGGPTAPLNNFLIEGNVIFNAGAGQGLDFKHGNELLIGGGPAHNNRVNNNHFYSQHSSGGLVQLGYGGSGDFDGLDLFDNYIVGQLIFPKPYANVDARRNIVVGSVSGPAPSSGIETVTSPSGQRVFVRPNQYESGRANIVVHNWDKASSVSVDLSEVLGIGSNYRVMHVYDFFGAPVVQGTYDGQPVNIPMQARKAPKAVGGGMGQCVTGPSDTWCFKEPTTLPATFGAFVVLSDGCGDSNPPPPVEEITATRTLAPVVIDGIMDECAWSATAQKTFTNQAKSIDNNVTFSALWNSDAVFSSAKVVDDSLEADAEKLFQDDGLELYFDVDNSKSTSLEDDDRQFKVNILGEASDATLQVAVHETSTGYSMEVRIPWTTLGTSPAEGLRLGLLIG